MNTWNVARKELGKLRDPKMIIYLTVTPLVLTLLLGTALSNAFQPSVSVGDIRVLYRIDALDEPLISYWNAFAAEGERAGIRFEAADSDEDARAAVVRRQAVGYAVLSEEGLSYLGNGGSPVENGIAQSYLSSFAERYKLAEEIAAAGGNGEQAAAVLTAPAASDYVRKTAPNAARKPGAMDYYAIAMVTLIVMFNGLTAAQAIDEERKRGTAARMLAAPVAKAEIFAGKLAGLFLMNAVSVTVVVLACKYMLNVHWGDRLAPVLAVLFSQIIFAISLGLGSSYLFKGPAASGVIMAIIQVGAFFGGSYFPLDSLTGTMRSIADFSPLAWTNEALLQFIYASDGAAAVKAMALNLGCSVLLLGTALLILRSREEL